MPGGMTANEAITITLSEEQAHALIDACNCFSDASEGNMAALLEVWTPSMEPDMGPANQMMIDAALAAQSVAHVLREHVAAINKRDPDLQDFLHRAKMHRKYGHLRDVN